MTIEKWVSDNLQNFDSWYDVAALCYDYLVSTITDQEIFIGEYILVNGRSENNNPNLEILKDFEEYANNTIHKNIISVCDGIKVILKKMLDIEKKLLPYGEPSLNGVTLVYFLLAAIDRYAVNARYMRHTPAPLNREYVGDSYIYFASPKSLIYEAATELRFRDTITDTSIKHCLSNLYILESRDCRGEKAPDVISLSFDIPEELPSLLHNPADLELIDNVLKVALIPFWGQQITDFKWTDGAKFVIRYSEEYINFATKRAIALLETAIDRKANIIVFPEFVCAPLVQCRIGEYLLDQYRRDPLRLKEVILVMGGSGWTNDNNNVMNMFDRCGNMIGEYYKYSKFWKDSSLEGLSEPGKKCTIIDVPGLGRILPSICRDVSNKEYTEGLIDSFRPFLLFTSAWSTSVEGGFKNQYDFFAKRYMVTSMLCNCCEAICPSKEDEDVKQIVNLIATPTKEGSICSTRFFELRRNDSCYKECDKHQCMFMVTADFSKESVKRKEIVFPQSNLIEL